MCDVSYIIYTACCFLTVGFWMVVARLSHGDCQEWSLRRRTHMLADELYDTLLHLWAGMQGPIAQLVQSSDVIL